MADPPPDRRALTAPIRALNKPRSTDAAPGRWLRACAGRLSPAGLLSWSGVAVLLGLAVYFGADAGITYDEHLQREYGKRVLAWYRSGFQNASAMTYFDLYLYGGLFDMCAQWLVGFSPLDEFDTRHMLTALLAVFGVVGSAKMAARVGGPWAGLLAGLTLALTPTWVGHGLFNPKDVPFAVAAAFATSAAVRLALGPALPPWSAVAWAGLTVGIALAVRAGGVFIVAYPCLAAASRALLELCRRARAREPLRAAGLIGGLGARAALMLTLAWLVMVSAWPWAQLSPIAHPLQAMSAASRFSWTGDVLFGGAWVDAAHLPWTYLPTWFAITLPEIYLLALACALFALARMLLARQRVAPETALGIGTIAVSVLLPLSAVFALQPVVYNAHRHFLFLFPPLAALAGIALASVLGPLGKPAWLRALVGAALALFAVQAGRDMAGLHPYEYVYFNRSFGGLKRAAGRYELDYWGASYKEGLAWVVNTLARRGAQLRVTACDPGTDERLRYYVEHWPGVSERIEVATSDANADIYLGEAPGDCQKRPGRVLHRVRREGVPLLYVSRPQAGPRD
jgi:hypothetical protein